MGYRIFALCLRQLLDNLPMAVRLSWFWLVVFGLVYAGSFGIMFFAFWPPTSTEPPTGAWIAAMAIFFPLILAVAVIAYCTIAIGWHRYILRDEVPDRFYVARPEWPLFRYFWNIFKIFLIMLLFIIPTMIIATPVLGSLFTTTTQGQMPSPSAAIIMMVFVLILGTINTWIILRLGMILPATALGKTISIADSFRLTRPLAAQLFITTLCMVLLQFIPGALEQGLVFLAGPSTMMSTLILPFHLIISCINLFVGIGVLTVVYGHLAENR
ncbi:MAG: hypothetical protein AAFW74_16350, partial [Pseudomonadota bacterium]